MYEVKVRDIPARSLLCLLRHASTKKEVWDLGKEVIGMLKAQLPPRVDGVAGAAFLIYYGEVNEDSDGPGRSSAGRCRRTWPASSSPVSPD